MTLQELKKAAEQAIEYAIEHGEDPSEIEVSLQIERETNDPVCSSFGVELHYDNNSQASGCVLLAYLPDPDMCVIDRNA